MKKTIFLFLLLILTATCACAQPLYENTTEEIVCGGVTLRNIRRFYGDYALEINIIKADLKTPGISLDLLKHSGGVDKTDTVMNLAKQNEDVVASVNADFFSAYKGDQNFSLGIEIKDNTLLQSHINSDMAAAFFEKGLLSFSYPEFSAAVTSPAGESTPLSHINKPTDYYGALLMYTADFNSGISPFLPEGVTAVTVENEKVISKGISLGGTIPIPANGYILVINDNMTPFLDHNFKIGDEVKLEISILPSATDTSMAVGGGTLLLKDGKKAPITHNVSGNHPRTAIGTSDNGRFVYLITVDGRQTHSRGVSLDVLSDILLEEGITDAMNFDGGGSTSMVGKTLSDTTLHKINTPSENRRVINAVAITSGAKAQNAVGAFAKAERDTVLSGDWVNLSLTPYDKNKNIPSANDLRTEWKISKGEGTIKNNVYYADGSGKTVIDLYCNGKKTDSVEIFVVDSVCGIVSAPLIKLEKGKSVTIDDVSVFDKDGNTAIVRDLSLLNPEFDKSLVSIKDGSITALSPGASTVTFSHSGASRSIKVICENYEIDAVESIFSDTLNKEETGGFTFNVLGFNGTYTLFDRLVFARSMDTFRKSGACAVVGGDTPKDLVPDILSPITAKGWSEKTVPGAKILSMLVSDGVLSRGEQWKNLFSILDTTQEKSVIILVDSEYAFSSDVDGMAFFEKLEKTAKDKNVFVVYNADENFCRIKNGVRYISVADSDDEGVIWRAIENTKYLSFNITEDGLTYSFKKLYN